MFGKRWQDLRSEHGSLLGGVAHFVEVIEGLPATRVDDMVRFALSVDGVALVGVLTVEGSLVVCHSVARDAIPLDRTREIDRFLSLANLAQRFASVVVSPKGEAYVRTSLDTDGIPVTPRALATLTIPNQLFARFFLPALRYVAVGEWSPEDAAARAGSDWQAFIASVGVTS
jgi:hypothetical protein